MAGHPEEYFYPPDEEKRSRIWKTREYPSFLQRVVEEASTPNGVCGLKIMWSNFDGFIAKVRKEIPGCRTMAVPQIMEALFPHLTYVFLSRGDKVKQAISEWRAMQTNAWFAHDERAVEGREPRFNFTAIDQLAQMATVDDMLWQRYFDEFKINPVRVAYEDLAMDPRATTLAVIRALGIELPADLELPEPRFQRQADALSEDWLKRYYEIKNGPATTRARISVFDLSHTLSPALWRLKRAAKLRYRWYARHSEAQKSRAAQGR